MNQQPSVKAFSSSWSFQLMAVFALIFIGILLGSLLTVAITKALGVDYATIVQAVRIDNSLFVRNLVRTFTIINQVAMFGAPALLFAVLIAGKWWQFFQFHQFPKFYTLGLGVLFLLSIFPLAQALLHFNKQLPLPDWAVSMESNLTDLIKGLLVMDTPIEFLFSVLTIALIPAICEEMMFRGVIQQQLGKLTARPVLAIWITAVIFSSVHGQFEGFLPRLLLGASLGYLYYWSGTLWVSIIAHAFNNGMQIAVLYFSTAEMQQVENLEPQIPFALVLLCTIFALSIGYLLNKQSFVNKS
ncbi:MAG: CPBP family intramembrane metalloprotease [Saprospiraceae bacterium]|nr:CPBP family intramembrane metalloprotease [Saprospiraceae bacterium]